LKRKQLEESKIKVAHIGDVLDAVYFESEDGTHHIYGERTSAVINLMNALKLQNSDKPIFTNEKNEPSILSELANFNRKFEFDYLKLQVPDKKSPLAKNVDIRPLLSTKPNDLN